MSQIKRVDGVLESLHKYSEQVGYIPNMFNPYNMQEITDIAPTVTAQCGSITKSSTVLIRESYLKETTANPPVIRRKDCDFKPITFVDTFAGIGGFRKPLERLGGDCVFSSEIDKHAARAYEALYDDKSSGDITKIKSRDIPDHDILTGGFPCVSFSTLGNGKGLEDVRGSLFYEIARIARDKQPKALLIENVKTLINHDSGNTLEVILTTLNNIGYIIDFNIINSVRFGVPQNRERAFVIAIRSDLIRSECFPDKVMKGYTVVPRAKRRLNGLIQTFNFDWPKGTNPSIRLRDILETNVDEKYYLDEVKTAQLVMDLEGNDSRHWFRKMTPLEVWRLQGFPDEAHDVVKAAGISDAQRFRQAGNAVTVSVVEAIAERLMKYL